MSLNETLENDEFLDSIFDYFDRNGTDEQISLNGDNKSYFKSLLLAENDSNNFPLFNGNMELGKKYGERFLHVADEEVNDSLKAFQDLLENVTETNGNISEIKDNKNSSIKANCSLKNMNDTKDVTDTVESDKVSLPSHIYQSVDKNGFSNTSTVNNIFGISNQPGFQDFVNKSLQKTKVPSKVNLDQTYIFQNPKESRLDYLLRTPRLFQEFMNSSNLEKLKCYIYDLCTEDVVVHLLTSKPMMGARKLYDMLCMSVEVCPDFYTICNNGKNMSKRIMVFKGCSFGTLPYTSTPDRGTSQITFWNFLGKKVENMNEFEKLQKEKFDKLVSEKKMIKFERRSTWYCFYNKERTKFEKIMAYQARLEIFEK